MNSQSWVTTVSYTHLDVYKRQAHTILVSARAHADQEKQQIIKEANDEALRIKKNANEMCIRDRVWIAFFFVQNVIECPTGIVDLAQVIFFVDCTLLLYFGVAVSYTHQCNCKF